MKCGILSTVDKEVQKSNTQGRYFLPCNLKQIKIQINLIFQNLIPKNKNKKNK